MGIDSTPIEYTLQCCSGKAISWGRVAHVLIVEGLDRTQSIQLKLPPVLECDSLPVNHTEIPTSDIARCFTHLRDKAKSFHELDSSAKILLLIGRDLSEAHHSLDQRTGPLGAPFAQAMILVEKVEFLVIIISVRKWGERRILHHLTQSFCGPCMSGPKTPCP